MNPVYNPFTPGAGTPPPELVGRGELLDEAKVLVERLKLNKPARGMILNGLRGVGKTVILAETLESVVRRAFARGVARFCG